MGYNLKKKEPIRIRTKQLANGNQSIYLDIYINGKREYEFLKLYIIPEHNKADKEANASAIKLANAIKAQKIVELQNNQHGFSNSGLKSKMLLVDYIRYLSEKDSEKTGRNISLHGLIHHLNRYDANSVAFKQLNKEYVIGFISYLKTAQQEHCNTEKLLSSNTQAYYCKMLKWCLNCAVFDDIILANPMDKVRQEEKPKQKRTEREYLTIDEIKTLANTDFHNEMLKQAFLFSCFCGLRHCDIVSLAWENIKKDKKGNAQLNLIQKKTKEIISLPLSKEAMKQLPPKGKSLPTDKVFDGLISLGRTNEILPKWALRAGINKHITFHAGRHTHATMMLTLGADLYTVSKLLGHKDIQVTQIYAEIIDESKRKAIDLIPDIID
ncbi:Tyrosine recombinase XerC [termite gut metagenome]|uniref:Tyrosine recombinase XerC n=1 Tax=termite gut metagenome TaxID=433724 RepID=A0A5J4RBJ8_9ZZZZ